MASIGVETGHIVLDEAGVPWVEGANTKVIEIVRDHVYLGFSPAEIHHQHPHLSLAQIHAALSYYFDHQIEVAADMERRDRLADAIQDASGPPTLPEPGQAD